MLKKTITHSATRKSVVNLYQISRHQGKITKRATLTSPTFKTEINAIASKHKPTQVKIDSALH